MTTTVASNGAEAIFEVLRGWGVRYVFICPGSTEAAFLDASFAYPDISIMTAMHESVVVAMADGYARATGKLAVAYLHTNVGLTNGLAHLSCAQLTNSPIVILNGLKSTRIQNQGAFTTAPSIRDFVRQYVKWDWQTLRADALAEDVNRACKLAAAEPQGPTYLAISQDLLETETQVPVPPVAHYQVSARTRPDPDQVATAAQLLVHASRPLIIAGDEVTRTNAGSELLALVEHLEAPFLLDDRTTLESTFCPTGHAHYSGLYVSRLQAVNDADVIVLAGTSTLVGFDWSSTPAFPIGTPLIHLSADASEIGKIYPADVPLVGNAKLGLADLLAALAQESISNSVQRQAYLRSTRDAYLAAREQAREESASQRSTIPVRVPALMLELANCLTPQTVVVSEPITSAVPALTHIYPEVEGGFYTTPSGSLGWAMGAALGIKLAEPDKEVLALVGDGVFQFGIQALWTAVHYNLPVIFVVINNQSYAAVKAALHRHRGVALQRQEFPWADISGPHIAEIGHGFGATSFRVELLADLAPTFQMVREQGGPAVIEVMTDRSDIGPRREKHKG